MSNPHKTSTNWRQLDAVGDVDGDRVTMTFHLLETNSGEEVTVSVTARSLADAGYYIAGLQAAAHALNHVAGGQPMEGATLMTRNESSLN